MPEFAQRALELRNLVVVRHVGVEVVLTGEHRIVVDGAVKGEARAGGILHGGLVQNGQHARHPGAHLADVGVGLHPERRGAGAEQLGFGAEVNMHFKADDGFISGHRATPKGRTIILFRHQTFLFFSSGRWRSPELKT